MSLRNRTLLLVTLLLVGAVLAVGAVLTWESNQSLYRQQAEDGLAIARLLARTAAIVGEFPQEMEAAIGEQMVVEASISAHLVALAEQAGLTPEQVNAHLKAIAAASGLDEFWITDASGTAIYRNVDVPFAFSPDPQVQPQAYVFWPLLTGEQSIVIQEARQREIDDQVFKYVGVSGVDGPRIVQVGYNLSFLENYRQRVGLARLVEGLVTSGDVTAIRLTDNTPATTLVYSADPAVELEPLSAADLAQLQPVLAAGGETYYLDRAWIKAVVPLYEGEDQSAVSGAVMVYLPTAQLEAALRSQLVRTGGLAALVLAVGVLASLWLSRRVTEPITRVVRAAEALEAGEYHPGLLAPIAGRRDELGTLGRVFEEMAGEVTARDRRLRLLRVVIPVGVALSAERDFNRLLEMIVVEAQTLTNADGGTLYLLTEDGNLNFMIVRTGTLGIAMGGTTGQPVNFPPLPLVVDGLPDHRHIATYVALTGQRVHVADAYTTPDYDFSGTRAFDQRTGYRSQSFLAVPLVSQEKKVIGVLQLINAQDPESGQVVPFASDDVIESLILLASAALEGYIREERLRQEIAQLRIEIDDVRKDQQVADIAESEYFQTLQTQVDALRTKRKRRKAG